MPDNKDIFKKLQEHTDKLTDISKGIGTLSSIDKASEQELNLGPSKE